MRVMSNGRIRRTEGEWRELLARCDGEGVSAREFCRKERVKISSFVRWRRRLEGAAQRPDFVTVTREPLRAVSSAPWSLELVLPNGHKLRIEG